MNLRFQFMLSMCRFMIVRKPFLHFSRFFEKYHLERKIRSTSIFGTSKAAQKFWNNILFLNIF